MEMNKQITFEPETQMKIGTVTYIVAAHFDDKQEELKTKITRLLCGEVSRRLSSK